MEMVTKQEFLQAVTATIGKISDTWDEAEAVINAKKTVRKTMDYREAKGMLTCRLVNPERNRAMLDSVPNLPFRDLSVSFCLMIDDMGYMTTNVTNEMMTGWGVSVDELYEDALSNMKKMPPEIRSVYSVMVEIAGVSASVMEKRESCRRANALRCDKRDEAF